MKEGMEVRLSLSDGPTRKSINFDVGQLGFVHGIAKLAWSCPEISKITEARKKAVYATRLLFSLAPDDVSSNDLHIFLKWLNRLFEDEHVYFLVCSFLIPFRYAVVMKGNRYARKRQKQHVEVQYVIRSGSMVSALFRMVCRLHFLRSWNLRRTLKNLAIFQYEYCGIKWNNERLQKAFLQSKTFDELNHTIVILSLERCKRVSIW